jgi:hypothetical protein
MLLREAAACLLTLAGSSRGNQKLLLAHEDDQQRGMAELAFGELLQGCGDYPMQVGGVFGGWRCAAGCERAYHRAAQHKMEGGVGSPGSPCFELLELSQTVKNRRTRSTCWRCCTAAPATAAPSCTCGS